MENDEEILDSEEAVEIINLKLVFDALEIVKKRMKRKKMNKLAVKFGKSLGRLEEIILDFEATEYLPFYSREREETAAPLNASGDVRIISINKKYVKPRLLTLNNQPDIKENTDEMATIIQQVIASSADADTALNMLEEKKEEKVEEKKEIEEPEEKKEETKEEQKRREQKEEEQKVADARPAVLVNLARLALGDRKNKQEGPFTIYDNVDHPSNATLPIPLYTGKLFPNDWICGACYVENEIELLGVTICGHVFHQSCLIKWFKPDNAGDRRIKNSCPICRRPTRFGTKYIKNARDERMLRQFGEAGFQRARDAATNRIDITGLGGNVEFVEIQRKLLERYDRNKALWEANRNRSRSSNNSRSNTSSTSAMDVRSNRNDNRYSHSAVGARNDHQHSHQAPSARNNHQHSHRAPSARNDNQSSRPAPPLS